MSDHYEIEQFSKPTGQWGAVGVMNKKCEWVPKTWATLRWVKRHANKYLRNAEVRIVCVSVDGTREVLRP